MEPMLSVMGELKLKPVDPYEAGLGYVRARRYADAIACFETILAREPDDIRALFALGNTAEAIGHRDAAETLFRQVLTKEPGRLEAVVSLANLLRANARSAEAIALLKPVVERDPAQPELWLTLGSAVRESGDAATAEIFYREALRLKPGYPPALGNLADLLADAGKTDEALSLYERVLASEPHNAQARLNRGIVHFIKGDLVAGWADYEYRLKIKSREIIPDHGLKRWKGRYTRGLKLLVTAEQGIGDQIMFASLIPELATKLARASGKLFLEAEPRLVSLFARSFPTVDVRPSKILERAGQKRAYYDWLVPGEADAAIELGSLPALMRASRDAFPEPNAYLKPDAAECARAGNSLKLRSIGPLIGICWRSSLSGGLRDLQFAPLAAWADFIRSLSGTAVSLQYDARDDEIAALKALSGCDVLVPPVLDQKREIDRTAALIASLNGVISAPTAVAWLSAALGMPTVKLVANVSWTAFGQTREPFAPACEVVAPAREGDWVDGLARASAALNAQLRS